MHLRTVITSLCLFLFSTAYGQDFKTIPLPQGFAGEEWEYSGLGKWNSTIILLPQYPGRYIYGLDSTYIHNSILGKKTTAAIHKWRLVNLEQVLEKIEYYEGFESIAVVENKDVFFTIETSKPSSMCWIIKGQISQDSIILDPQKTMALPKFKKIKSGVFEPVLNAGYEALVWLPESDKLFTVFEYNKYDTQSHGLLIDRELSGYSYIKMPAFDFRLTDMATANDHIYAINFWYPNEYKAYEPTEQIKKGNLAADWEKDAYTRIIELKADNQRIEKTRSFPLGFISCNWEGIISFSDGFLLINDKYLDKNKRGSTLVFWKIPAQ